MLPRSRRRAHYGAYLCAFTAAILLLISVALLHSRLTSSGNHHHHPSLQSFNDVVVSSTNPLLDDPDSISISQQEDRIDEHDVTINADLDQSRASEIEDEDENANVDYQGGGVNTGSSSNRYYFDHLIGVIRRSYSKRSIDEWEDDGGFELGMYNEDKSKGAFGSDDVAVDEDVREKAGEVRGVEDALLLKTPGRRVSPLRDGWGQWFDTKSDFLRRDKMFKSNLELLNPLNNPLLQDPDGVGVTGLTRGDRLLKKGLLSQLKKVPFPSNKKLLSSIVGETDSESANVKGNGETKTSGDNGEFGSIGDVKSEVKRAERRTLDNTNSNGHNSDKTNDNESMQQKNVESSETELGSINSKDKSVMIKSEVSEHVYADGNRWGYFPGLHPHLSFSNFMDAFFRKGKCSMRFFMVWNSPPWAYGVRHKRGLETVLLHHRDACIVVFSETIELDFFKDFVKEGYKVAVAMPDLDNLLKDTPAHVFASVWFEWRKTNFYSTHNSELVRLAALYKYGGIYLDSDILVLKPLATFNNSVGLEDQLAGSSLNGAVMAFRKHSPFIMECLKEYYSTYDDTRLRWNGADLLSRVAKKISSEEKNSGQLELTLQPSFIFFPVNTQNIRRYFTAPATEMEKAEQDALFRKILNESFTFHFWNSITSTLVPEAESLVSRIIGHSCIHCSDVL